MRRWPSQLLVRSVQIVFAVEVFLNTLDTRATIRDSIGRAGNRGGTSVGAIPEDVTPILDRLGVDRSNWVDTVRDFGRMFKQAAGRASPLVRAAPRSSRRWFQGKAAAHVAFL
jgi:hypothetical protein